MIHFPLQYNTLLSDMETTYSVAKVCRENKTCHPLDPGKTWQGAQRVICSRPKKEGFFIGTWRRVVKGPFHLLSDGP